MRGSLRGTSTLCAPSAAPALLAAQSQEDWYLRYLDLHGDPGTTWLLANGTKSVNSSPSFSLGQTWRSFSRAHKFGQIFARLAKQRLLSHVNLGLYVLFTSIISALHRKRRPHIDSPRSPIDHSLFHVRSLFVESIPTKPINTAPPYYSPSHHYHELRREEEVRHIE